MEDTNQIHYVCSECGFLSHHPGNCQTEGCMQEGAALKRCACADGQHAGVMNRSGESADDQASSSTSQTVDLDSGSF
jgi:hypothetical protein